MPSDQALLHLINGHIEQSSLVVRDVILVAGNVVPIQRALHVAHVLVEEVRAQLRELEQCTVDLEEYGSLLRLIKRLQK